MLRCSARSFPVIVRLPIFNPQCACAGRVMVVGSVCVCRSVNLTSEASVRPEIDVTYSAGNEGQGFFVKILHSKVMV